VDPTGEYHMENDDTGPPGPPAPATPAEEVHVMLHTGQYPVELGGPLTVAVNIRPSGQGASRVNRSHFFRTNAQALGGSYTYRPQQHTSWATLRTGPDYADKSTPTWTLLDPAMHYASYAQDGPWSRPPGRPGATQMTETRTKHRPLRHPNV
jgi:hypothetical protein